MSYQYPEFRNSNNTNVNAEFVHGQVVDGYWYDANFGQWRLVDPEALVAGRQSNPSKRVLIGAGIAVVGALVLGIGIANWAADDAPESTTSVAAAPLSKDDQYLEALRVEANIVPVTTDTTLIQSATNICNGYEDGLSYSTMSRQIYLNNDVSRDQADSWVDIATRIFCPEFS